MATVYDIAAYVLNKLGNTTTMKLQKLLYYCQAWSLVWDEKPLFQSRIEAWANGPVVVEFYEYHKGMFNIDKVSNGNPNVLTVQEKETVDSVIAHYGNKTSQYLVDLTHHELPWRDARVGLRSSDRGHNEITLASMAEYYGSL